MNSEFAPRTFLKLPRLTNRILIVFGCLSACLLIIGGMMLDNALQQRQHVQADRLLKMEADTLTPFLNQMSESEQQDSVEIWFRKAISSHERQAFLGLWDSDGELRALHSIEPLAGIAVPADPAFSNGIATLSLESGRYRVFTQRLEQGGFLKIGHGLAPLQQQKTKRRFTIATALLLFWLLLTLGTLLLSKLIIKPLGLGSLTDDSSQQNGLPLKLIPYPPAYREIEPLVLTFNRAIDQLDLTRKNHRLALDNISHDLYTPLTRMRCLAESMIGHSATSTDALELGGEVIEECDHMLNLVETLIDISAAESGTKTWNLVSIDLVEQVQNGCELFGPVLENKHLRLELDLPQRLFVLADIRTLQRVISNLLDNAIKFTPKDGLIKISVNRHESEASLQIEDTGIGIQDHQKPWIFSRLFRSDFSRGEVGSGLGLSFCKAVIESMGGRISFESEWRRGSSFKVGLPLTNSPGSTLP